MCVCAVRKQFDGGLCESQLLDLFTAGIGGGGGGGDLANLLRVFFRGEVVSCGTGGVVSDAIYGHLYK